MLDGVGPSTPVPPSTPAVNWANTLAAAESTSSTNYVSRSSSATGELRALWPCRRKLFIFLTTSRQLRTPAQLPARIVRSVRGCAFLPPPSCAQHCPILFGSTHVWGSIAPQWRHHGGIQCQLSAMEQWEAICHHFEASPISCDWHSHMMAPLRGVSHLLRLALPHPNPEQ